ncbi:hypothetical protein GWL_37810 [Herbaspirillum sp. GW103]|nr:hypothetical protein GWL_37810 [Herbaspirillum sp. GW103]
MRRLPRSKPRRNGGIRRCMRKCRSSARTQPSAPIPYGHG